MWSRFACYDVGDSVVTPRTGLTFNFPDRYAGLRGYSKFHLGVRLSDILPYANAILLSLRRDRDRVLAFNPGPHPRDAPSRGAPLARSRLVPFRPISLTDLIPSLVKVSSVRQLQGWLSLVSERSPLCLCSVQGCSSLVLL